MNYFDFELRVTRVAERDYAVCARSPIGESTATMQFPFDARELEAHLQSIARGVLRSGPPGGQIVESEPSRRSASEFGRRLFEALFTGGVLEAFRRSQDRAEAAHKGLRVQLRFEAANLAVLPWEFMWDPVVGDFVCLSRYTPLVRYVELARPPEPLAVRLPLRILAMIASPSDVERLDVDHERRRVEEAIAPLAKRDLVHVQWINGTWRALQRAMRGDPWHILHFIGHGGFDAATDEGVLVLENDDGKKEPLAATEFARFADQTSLRLVVLNACLGARGSERDAFSSTSSVLVRRGVPAVVAMQFEISDGAAIEFSRSFYAAIADGKPVDESVTEARKAMTRPSTSIEWGTPVLYMRSPDGRLFSIDRSSSAPEHHREPLAAEGEKSRRKFLEDVKGEVDDRLAQSFHAGARLTIRKENQPGQVARPWDAEVKNANRPATLLPAGAGIVDVFDRQDVAGKLVILGGPGSGKTTTLLELADTLIERARNDDAVPMPVVLTLSSWTGEKGQTLASWMVDELKVKHGVNKQVSQTWLERRLLIPLFDGLDEVAGERQERCLDAINRFQHEHRFEHLVVCCRAAQYENYSVKLQLRGAVHLLPLTDDQIRAYLTAEDCSNLWDDLRADPESLALTRCPLLLRMMVSAPGTSGRDGPIPATALARVAQRIDAYVRNALSPRDGTREEYPSERARCWLTWMSKRMAKEGQSEFLMERLQPHSLRSSPQRWFYRVGVVISAAVLFAVAELSILYAFNALLSAVPRAGPRTEFTQQMKTVLHQEGYVSLNRAVLMLMALAVGLTIAFQSTIRPVETLVWRWSRPWQAMTHESRRMAITGFVYVAYAGIGLGVMAAALEVGTTNSALFARANSVLLHWKPVAYVMAVFALVLFAASIRRISMAARAVQRIDKTRIGSASADALLCASICGFAVVQIIGVPAGMSSALGIAAFVVLTAASNSRTSRACAKAIVIGSLAGLGAGLTTWLTVDVHTDIAPWLEIWSMAGLGAGTSVAVIVTLTRAQRWRAQVREADSVTRRWGKWLLIGLASAVVSGAALVWLWKSGHVATVRAILLVTNNIALVLATSLAYSFAFAVILGCAIGMAWGAFLGALYGALNGVKGPDIERRVQPNQGIRQSAANIAKLAGAGWVIVGLPFGLANVASVAWTIGAFPTVSDWIDVGLGSSILFAILGGFIPAAACIQHYNLRFVLWCSGLAPLRYARFLDYATRRGLLQRVGGRYRFIHDLLRDHLAGADARTSAIEAAQQARVATL